MQKMTSNGMLVDWSELMAGETWCKPAETRVIVYMWRPRDPPANVTLHRPQGQGPDSPDKSRSLMSAKGQDLSFNKQK